MTDQATGVCPVTGMGPSEIAEKLDPFGPDYLADPYPVFAKARAGGNVYYSDETGYWVLTRYADVKQVLRDTTNFSADIGGQPLQPLHPAALEELGKVGFVRVPALNDSDAPHHVRVRRQVNKAFNARRLKLLEPGVRELARRHVDNLGSGLVDFVPALAWPLPALVLFRLFGMPEEDLGLIKQGSADRVTLTTGRPTEEESRRAGQGLAAFYAYCTELIADRRANLRDDFPSDLIRAGEGQADPLNDKELVQVVYALLFAGHETTTQHLTHLLNLVLQESGLWARLREDRDLIPGVVEEVLRLQAPVINWRRRAKVDVEVGGVTLPADAKVLLLLGSANHDDAVFENPDALVPDRENVRTHLTFGFGEHLCLGAPLARMEGRMVLEEMVDRFAEIGLPEQELEFAPSLLFRGPQSLLLQF